MASFSTAPAARRGKRHSTIETLEAEFNLHRAQRPQQRAQNSPTSDPPPPTPSTASHQPPPTSCCRTGQDELREASHPESEVGPPPPTPSTASHQPLPTSCCPTCQDKSSRISQLESEVRQLYSRLEEVGRDVDVANRRRFAAEELLYKNNLPKLKF